MRIRYDIADFNVAAASVQARVQDPRALVERVWDGGDHADAAGMSDPADVRAEDVEDEGAFDEGLAGPWVVLEGMLVWHQDWGDVHQRSRRLAPRNDMSKTVA